MSLMEKEGNPILIALAVRTTTALLVGSIIAIAAVINPVTQSAVGTSLTTTISIVNGAADPNNGQFYVPNVANITTGTTVEWINDDPIPHTVTSGSPEKPTKEFDSGLMSKGEIFDHTFSKAGSFDYYCIPHPWMTGRVVVS